jgi:hypothetical protein
MDIVVTGSDPVTKLRKALLNAGVDPGLPLKVWRGGAVWVTCRMSARSRKLSFARRVEAAVLSKQEEELERREVLENDRLVREQQQQRERGSTFLDHYHDDTSGGRFASLGAPTVVGRDGVTNYPPAAAQQRDPVPDEPPLGHRVDEMIPLDPIPPEQGIKTDVAQDFGGAAAPSLPVSDAEPAPPSSPRSEDQINE